MNNEKKQELLELFNNVAYMHYYEILGLIKNFMPEHSKFIIRMLDNDIQQFKLKVSFWETYDGYGGTRPLLEPEYAETSETLQYYLPAEHHAGFWRYYGGKLSTKEFQDWLQTKSIDDFWTVTQPFITNESQVNNTKPETPLFKKGVIDEKPKRKYRKGAVSIQKTAVLFDVSARTIQNWDDGINMPDGYPGRNDIVELRKFANLYYSKKQTAKVALAMKRAVSGGDVAGRALKKSDGNDDDDYDEN